VTLVEVAARLDMERDLAARGGLKERAGALLDAKAMLEGDPQFQLPKRLRTVIDAIRLSGVLDGGPFKPLTPEMVARRLEEILEGKP
jgi:hypothetical protein